MLSLPPRVATILDYIDDTWQGEVCSSCGSDIDVCWHPDEFDALGQWKEAAWFAAHCPACVIDATPKNFRSLLVDHYDGLRTERLRLGLGRVFPGSKMLSPVEPDEMARESLRWRSGAITLHAATWRRLHKNGKNPAGGLYMVQLLIEGMITEFGQGRLNPEVIARRPSFELELLEIPRRPGWTVESARVLIGTTIHDPRSPGLQWRYGWTHSLPASMGFFSLPPDWEPYDYSPAKIGAFVKKAMGLFQARDQGGRPSLVDAECEWYFDEADRYVSENNGKIPTKAEFLTFTGRPESTMRGHLETCDLWPWADFKDRAFMSLRARKR